VFIVRPTNITVNTIVTMQFSFIKTADQTQHEYNVNIKTMNKTIIELIMQSQYKYSMC